MPPAAVDALVDAPEHPARVHSIGGRDFDLRRDVVAKLAEIGDERAAEALRRFADDPEIGQEAAEAVRAIEARVFLAFSCILPFDSACASDGFRLMTMHQVPNPDNYTRNITDADAWARAICQASGSSTWPLRTAGGGRYSKPSSVI